MDTNEQQKKKKISLIIASLIAIVGIIGILGWIIHRKSEEKRESGKE
jgi:flagellar basal body-associated protein FliL